MATILVVDDEPDVLETVCGLLERIGHRVVGATDGFEALERFERDRHDLVVVNIFMPRMGGLELIRRLRLIDGDARIVVLTGAMLDVASALLSVGIRVVHKPLVTIEDATALVAPSLG